VLTYRLLRDVLWIPAAWHRSGGYGTDQVTGAFLALLFDGITATPTLAPAPAPTAEPA
jgi:hypothetical protein